MRNYKFLAAMVATLALMFSLATSDVMACIQPFDVLNDTGQNITKITITYCSGVTYDITGIGPLAHVHTNIPCGTICSITVEVNGVVDGTVTVPSWGTLPSFPGGVLADQAHIHLFP